MAIQWKPTAIRRFDRPGFAQPLASALLAFALFAAPAAAQDYPSKPLRIVVPSNAGSAPDIVARSLGEPLAKALGQPVVIDNKPGAGGAVAMASVKAVEPDGYTLVLIQAQVATLTPLLQKSANYDSERDFDAIGMVGVSPMMFAGSPKFPARNLKEAIEAARAKPDEVTAGGPNRTSIPYLANFLLASKAPAPLRMVPFSSSPQGIQATMAGDVQMYTDGVGPLLALARGGRLQALAVTADTELPGLEGIPLAKDTVPGLVVYGWFMLAAPKGVPPAIVQKLNAELNAALDRPEVAARLRALGTYPRPMTIPDTVRFVRAEKETFGALVRQMGLQPE